MCAGISQWSKQSDGEEFPTSMRCAAVRLRKFGKYPCQELLCPTLPGSGAPLAIYVIDFRIVYLNKNVIIWPLAEFVVIFIILNPNLVAEICTKLILNLHRVTIETILIQLIKRKCICSSISSMLNICTNNLRWYVYHLCVCLACWSDGKCGEQRWMSNSLVLDV